MNTSTSETVVSPASPPSAEVPDADFRKLFLTLACALSFDALRLKPREKQLALILGLESFANGLGFGAIDMGAWRLRLSTWRSNELKNMIADWKRSGWLALDATEKTFRLAPDRFPGWVDVQTIAGSEQRNGTLGLLTEDDLPKTLAKFSQEAAKFSQRGVGGISETFNRSDVKRSNVERFNVGSCENFATSDEVSNLKDLVRKFVGDADWSDKRLWNSGLGYRHTIFMEESTRLRNALNYCEAGLKSGECRIKKTRGAMLWNEFQRLRREPLMRIDIRPATA
jgi:hypothetical protein